MREPLLEINGLSVAVEEKTILENLNLTLCPGEIHVLMGPNGAGKSTLASAIMGDPRYTVTAGSLRFEGEDITEEKADARARRGIFLSFQTPEEIPGITLENFLRTSRRAITGKPLKVIAFGKELKQQMAALDMDPSYAQRYLNVGFSGGEKKKAEILQLLMLKPKLAMLDETDSGLDVDALRIVGEGVNSLRSSTNSFVVITHYQRLLSYIVPDVIHVLYNGRIIRTAGRELAREIEERGYDWIIKEANE